MFGNEIYTNNFLANFTAVPITSNYYYFARRSGEILWIFSKALK